MNLLSRVLLAAGAAALAASCGARDDAASTEDTTAAPETATAEFERREIASDNPELAKANLDASLAFLSENAKKDGVTVTDTGLQYVVLEEGPDGGASPVSTDQVQVHYVGTLKDGGEFDSSRARGAAATFPLNQVIPGWTEGVQLMSEGDTFRFFVPPDLGYGERGTPGGPIGPNEVLIFEVELIKVQNAERNLEEANAFLEENAAKDGVKVTESGLQYQVLTEGPDDGAVPTPDDIVKLHFVGSLINGTEFASSVRQGRPAEFQVSQVIEGWTEAVQLMSVGDKYRFFLPPKLAYGETGGGPIGPNELIILEVELLGVEEPPAPEATE